MSHADNIDRYNKFYRIAGNWSDCYDVTLLRGMLLAIDKHAKEYDGLTLTEMSYRGFIEGRIARFQLEQKLAVAT